MCMSSPPAPKDPPPPPAPPPPPMQMAAVAKSPTKLQGSKRVKRRGTAQLTRPSMGGNYQGPGVNLPK